uniref:glycosyltransferase family 2 protein n=1 Tax=Acetatifactor sp. TaxID=1872090 RepID=UPI0040575825
MKIDVIIPLYKPGKELFMLLDALNNQTVSIENIILMNTEEKYFEQLVYGTHFADRYKNVKVFHLSKREFDHGKTRNMGVLRSDADIFVMMTQDAIPAENTLLEKLTAQLKDDVAVAYARQLPKEDCSPEEQFSRRFNYPECSHMKSLSDVKELGIKTFFCSNVCAAYRRDIYNQLGGFVSRAIFNEDMIYAAGAIQKGYKISYEAEAKVFHSHNYTHMQQLRRNFDLGVSQADHPEIFEKIPSESEGMKLVKATTQYLKENHKMSRILYFYMQCACKYAGYLLGKKYKKLPRKVILWLTSNKEYWK